MPGPATVGPGNRLLTAGPLTFTYDAEGNVTQKVDTASGQVTRYSFDHRNQLVLATIHASAAAPPTTTVAFEYDYAGRMMSRSLNGTKTWILYDRQMPVAEFADGAATMSAGMARATLVYRDGDPRLAGPVKRRYAAASTSLKGYQNAGHCAPR